MKRLSASFFLLSFSLLGLAAPQSFTPDSYLRHVKFLASDELRGRGNGTPELDRAADYIAAQFKASGLTPAGDDGSYFQKFQAMTGNRMGPGNRVTLSRGGRSSQANVGKDFLPIGIGEKTSVTGEVVFAGYGITAEEYKYDDYKNLDVQDKIVLVLADEPQEQDPNSPFNGREITLHARDNTKAIQAKYNGARAILIVQDPVNHLDASRDLPSAAGEAQVDDLGICALRVTRALAQEILGGSERALVDLQRGIDANLTPQSFLIKGVTLTVDLDVVRVRKEVRNIVASLPATAGKEPLETIILGAHYDHLGLGGRSSMSAQLIGQIHNGADDNASGAAGLIELAGMLSKNPAARNRSYLFIAFAGEELGLLGSAFWTGHPTVPLDRAIAMINMDMIGRPKSGQITVGGVGSSPIFPDLVATAAAASGLKATTSQSGYGSSDHTSFNVKNIPVLFFFSGLHSDYHRPSDDWDKIDSPGAVKVLAMIFRIATELNSLDTRPLFTKTEEPNPGGARGGSGYGAYFGSIPDMSDEVQGVRFSDVRPNSPAAKAGLKGADVMIRFAGKEIKNLEDFTFMLRTHKPGEAVEVTVMRDGKPLTVQVVLEVRR